MDSAFGPSPKSPTSSQATINLDSQQIHAPNQNPAGSSGPNRRTPPPPMDSAFGPSPKSPTSSQATINLDSQQIHAPGRNSESPGGPPRRTPPPPMDSAFGPSPNLPTSSQATINLDSQQIHANRLKAPDSVVESNIYNATPQSAIQTIQSPSQQFHGGDDTILEQSIPQSHYGGSQAAVQSGQRPGVVPVPGAKPSQFVEAARPQHEGSQFQSQPAQHSNQFGTILPGQNLGQYTIDKEVGRGAMGLVFLATDSSLGRKVAIKALPATVNSNSDAVLRFEREAEAIARLEHPNIVSVYGNGFDQGVHYYAMQFVQGQDLAELIASVKPSYRRAAEIIAKCAHALNYAHSLGVLHRDIKPANILIENETDQPLLTDFGLARLEGNASLTTEGTILGTPVYMAPEQASGDYRLTRQADIYSLGATLYEVVTGVPPYQGRDARKIILTVLREAPRSPKLADPYMPDPLYRIITKAMARRPSDRYTTARAMAEDLEAYLQDRPVKAQSIKEWTSPSERSYGVMAGVAAAIGLIIMTALVVNIINDNGSGNNQPSLEELNKKADGLKIDLTKPTAPTPELDDTLEDAMPLTDTHVLEAQSLASERDIEAKKALDNRVEKLLNDAVKAQAQKLFEEAREKFKEGDDIGGFALLKQSMDTNPKFVEPKLYLARYYSDNDQFEDAVATYSEMLLNPDTPLDLLFDLRFERGVLYISFEEPERDVLAMLDLNLVSGKLRWRAQTEIILMHTKRRRFAKAYVLQDSFIRSAEANSAISNGQLTADELAERYLHQAMITLKIGKEKDDARRLLTRAKQVAERESELHERIDEQILLLDAPPESPEEGDGESLAPDGDE